MLPSDDDRDSAARLALVAVPCNGLGHRRPVIHREEAISLLFTVTDILGEARAIRELLEGEDDGEEEEGVSN
jgi:hypothetical protein